MGGNVKILQLCKTYELIMKEKEWLTINPLKINAPRRVRTYVTTSYHELEKKMEKKFWWDLGLNQGPPGHEAAMLTTTPSKYY